MAITPDGLEAVASDYGAAAPLESCGRQRLIRPLVKLPQDVHLALATGAWTRPAQSFQGNEALAAIVPFDGQFISDRLQIHGSHGYRIDERPA